MMQVFIRLYKALGYSWSGLKLAWQSEYAFRLELYLSVILLPIAFLLPVSLAAHFAMVASWLLVVVVELVNTAIEAIVDRISTAKHPLSKKAKDVGSAAVLVALINAGILWGWVLWRFIFMGTLSI